MSDHMQRVTNCLIINEGSVLLLKKPRYGWYAMPGGKMEPKESVSDAVIREVTEETGLIIEQPKLVSVATMNKPSANHPKDEWMMFTFIAHKYHGNLVEECAEGELEWVPLDRVKTLPTAPSDKIIHDYALVKEEMLFARFDLNEQDELTYYHTHESRMEE